MCRQDSPLLDQPLFPCVPPLLPLVWAAESSPGITLSLRELPSPRAHLFLRAACVHVKGIMAWHLDPRLDDSRLLWIDWGLCWGCIIPPPSQRGRLHVLLPSPQTSLLPGLLSWDSPLKKPSCMQTSVSELQVPNLRPFCFVIIKWDRWSKCLVWCLKSSRSSVNVPFCY